MLHLKLGAPQTSNRQHACDILFIANNRDGLRPRLHSQCRYSAI